MENQDNKEDKEDNSYTKQVNEEKGDTVMKFKIDKVQDKKEEEENYNNSELNNVDSRNNYDSHLKTENKIRLNPDALKQSKLGTDKELMESKNNNEKNEEKPEDASTFKGIGGNLMTKINRIFSDKIIIIIIIIMLLFSILLLMFSILDFIKIMKSKSNKNLFMSNILFFILDVINISSILAYHMMNYLLKPKEVHNIILLLIIILFIFSIMRCFQYVKKNEDMFAAIINLGQNFFANLINCLTLFFFFIDSKKRKNAMHGIEEIINFTELNANVNSKKENGLQLDIMSNKDKPTALVEEEENNNNNDSNAGKE